MKKLILFVLFTTLLASCNKKETSKKEVNKTHEQSMAEMFPKPKVDIKTVGILLYDNYAVLDAMGPYHVFSDLMGVKVFLSAEIME